MDENLFNWIVKQHEDTNHMYDKYLPYRFHLSLVANVAEEFINSYLIDDTIKHKLSKVCILYACIGHDLLEDTRASYNDIFEAIKLYDIFLDRDEAKSIVEIIRAVTNYNRGRNREERMPDFCYKDIKNTPGATFVKLCDRIANVRYGKLTKSSMTNKYKEEHKHFASKLYVPGQLESMWKELENLLF